jgi:hypothetical protein
MFGLVRTMIERKVKCRPRRKVFCYGLETLESRCLPSASFSVPFFAPYVNTLENPDYSYATAAQNGVKDIVMGFMTADSEDNPAWDGQDELGSTVDNELHQQVNALRALGGDVMVSFGGATTSADPELGTVIGNVSQLQAAYQQVITNYSLTAVDFDLEGITLTANGSYDGPINTSSIDTRSAAIAGLQSSAAQAGKSLQVWFTLPVFPGTSGLTASGLYVVQSALAHGVNIAGVNIMTMDYYDGVSYDGTHAPTMGETSIALAKDVFSQLKAMPGLSNKTDTQIWQMIGVTPQIGVNVPTPDQSQSGVENFTEADAQALEAFAQEQGLGRLSMWSLNKDQYVQGEGPSQIWEDSSGLIQQPFAFSQIFEQFVTASQPPTVVKPATAAASNVTTTSTNLSVLGNDADGGADLTYTWSTIGTSPGPVTFSVNGTSSANDTTATFTAAGTYDFQVAITDAAGQSVNSSVALTVDQKQTRIVISPGTKTISLGASQQFATEVVDQFGNALAKQPKFTWAVLKGGGKINAAGLYVAPTTASMVIVRALADGLNTTASLTVIYRSTIIASFVDSNDSSSGFTGYITLTNIGTTKVNGWTLEFIFGPRLTAIWNAKLISHVSNFYEIRDISGDATIAPGQSVSFGFNATPDNLGNGPTNYMFNGHPITRNQGQALATFVDTYDWGTGFTGYITITNTGTTTINGWTLAFNFAPAITDIWNAQIVSQNGNDYMVENASWNAAIAPGQSINFGFTAEPDDPGTGPTNYLLNGIAVM